VCVCTYIQDINTTHTHIRTHIYTYTHTRTHTLTPTPELLLVTSDVLHGMCKKTINTDIHLLRSCTSSSIRRMCVCGGSDNGGDDDN
jgi:hypothetical protein